MIATAIIDRLPFRPHLASQPPRWRRRRRRLKQRRGRGSRPPPPPAEVAIPAVQHVTAVAVHLLRCSRHRQLAHPTSCQPLLEVTDETAPPCCLAVQPLPSRAVRPAFVPLHTPRGEAALCPLPLAEAPPQGACPPAAVSQKAVRCAPVVPPVVPRPSQPERPPGHTPCEEKSVGGRSKFTPPVGGGVWEEGATSHTIRGKSVTGWWRRGTL